MLRGYNNQNYTERALELVEYDICYLAHMNWGYGMAPEDIAQELRMHLWNKIHLYDPGKASIRTWSQRVMRMRLIDMSRKKKELLDSDLREMYPDLGDIELSGEWELEELIITTVF